MLQYLFVMVPNSVNVNVHQVINFSYVRCYYIVGPFRLINGPYLLFVTYIF